MKKIFTIISIAAVAAILAGCNKEEKMVIQKSINPASPEDIALNADYYAALRAYKESDHVLSYVYMGRYATLEGASNLYVEYNNLEHRFLALPDSLDFVNLWMGAPTDKPHSDYCFFSNGEPDYQFDYSPICYADMQYCRKYKGTKFVLHADATHWGQQFQLIDWNESKQQNDTTKWTLSKNKQDSHEAYAEFLYRKCLDYDLDGLDFDFEPQWQAKHIDWVINYLYDNKKMGKPAREAGENELILIIDYYGGMPPQNSIDKADYIVNQAYSVQSGLSTWSQLSNPNPKKWILCEQWEQGSNPVNWEQGGKKWSDPSKNEKGEDLYSMEAYALFCKQGGAKGFGAYYIDNDYKISFGPYNNYGYLRNAIQAANPAGATNEEE